MSFVKCLNETFYVKIVITMKAHLAALPEGKQHHRQLLSEKYFLLHQRMQPVHFESVFNFFHQNSILQFFLSCNIFNLIS